MTISRTTACNKIDIRSPRWKQRVIGIAKYRVGLHNEITISATDKNGKRYYPDTYYMSGEDIRKHEVQRLTSGVELYLIPINELTILERE